MTAFCAVVCYEYRMAVRRPGLWAGSALAAWLYALTLVGSGGRMIEGSAWEMAGTSAVTVNLFMPVIGGIAIADRLVRDGRLGVRELLCATSLPPATHLLGKYVGAVLAALTPLLAILFAGTAWMVAWGASPWLLGAVLVAFLAINVPTYAFIGAFSLVCPVAIPLHVYQVLYTGYWGWANFIPPSLLPTVNGTLLAPAGIYAASAFFHAPGVGGPYTIPAAIHNLAILLACATVALGALHLYLTRQGRLA